MRPSGLSHRGSIMKAVVIGSYGSVSPYVMTQILVEGENYYYFQGQKQKLRQVTFEISLIKFLNFF
jgi:hypothetical protein